MTSYSKLQTEVALSSTEIEHIALSTMMRTMWPKRKILVEITKQYFAHLYIVDKIVSTSTIKVSKKAKNMRFTKSLQHVLYYQQQTNIDLKQNIGLLNDIVLNTKYEMAQLQLVT